MDKFPSPNKRNETKLSPRPNCILKYSFPGRCLPKAESRRTRTG